MSESADMIGESLDRLLAAHVTPAVLAEAEQGTAPTALWNAVEQAGFTRVLLDEDDGGTGGGWNDAYAVLHVLGHARVPLPLADTIVGNRLLAQAGLPVADGAGALVQQPDGDALRLRVDGGRLVLSGTVAAVPWAGSAARLLVGGIAGDRPVLGVVEAGAAGLSIAPGRSIAAEALDNVTFDRCACSAFATAPDGLAGDSVLLAGALARSVQMAGGLEWMLLQTVRHAKDRVQFGRPLAGFQAVKQSLAVIASETVAADVAARGACEAAARGDGRFEIAVAKIRAGQAVGRSNMLAHQIHGAMGFTYEHTLHFTTRRLWSWRADFGNEARWAREIGRAAVERGGDRFWEDLTARQDFGAV